MARISISMLKAIENDQFQDLPSLVYLKNFLKSYAEILHLNSDKVVGKCDYITRTSIV